MRKRDNGRTDGYEPDIDETEDFTFHMNLDESYDPENSFDDYDGGDYDDSGYSVGYDDGGQDMRTEAEDSRMEDDNAYMPQDGRRYKKSAKKAAKQQGGSGQSEDIASAGPSKKALNRKILGVMYVFLGMFFAMIGYFIYFDIVKSDNVVNNPNNVRVAKFSETVSRGKILASDGSILAETLVDSKGNEYRSYPYKNIFAHVVGTSQINKSGLESSNEFNLLSSNINPLQKAYNELKGVKSPGDNITTTLNVSLQQAAYNALGSNHGVVIAIEPSTGKVLAMVSKPDYDPNTLAENYDAIISDKESKVLLNQATFGQFTPGSIFKVVTALEYMREYPNFGNYSYTCNGSINLASGNGEATLTCYNRTVHGTQDLRASFANSCNSSFANIGVNLNITSFNDIANRMLFNRELPTSIPHSKSSFTLDKTATKWEIGATAIGQGKTVITPLHAAMITSAIANGGIVMKPYLVDNVSNASGGQIQKFLPESYGDIMTTTEANRIREMMEAVVTEGTGTGVNGLGFTVAGKTGTAEVENSGNNAWFIGFAPAEKPKIALCVLVENSNTSSSYAAVPIAKQLFLSYLNAE